MHSIRYYKAIALVSMLLLLGVTACSSNSEAQHSTIPSPEDTVTEEGSSGQLTPPPETSEMEGEDGFLGGSGIQVSIDELQRGVLRDNRLCDVCQYAGGPITARVRMASRERGEREYRLFILANGIPVPFQVDGETYLSYPSRLTQKASVIETVLDPGYTDSYVRLDFVLADARRPDAEFYSTCMTFHLGNLQESSDIPDIPTNEAWRSEAVEARPGVRNMTNGYLAMSWLNAADPLPEEGANMGPRAFALHAGDAVLFEMVTSYEGRFRVTLFTDAGPLHFVVDGKEQEYLDWESTQDNMLQQKLLIPEDADLSGGSFYAVAVPLDAKDYFQQPIAMLRTRLTE